MHVINSMVGLSIGSLIGDAQSLIDTLADTWFKMNKLDSDCIILSDIDNNISVI